MRLGHPVRPDPAAILRLADQATELSCGEWSVALLQAAFPEATRAAIVALPVGARDRLVLAVRAALLPGPLRAEPVCGACGAVYDLVLDPADLGFGPGMPWPRPEPQEVTVDGAALRLRPVLLEDLLAIEAVADPAAAAALLAARVTGASLPAEMSPETLGAALERLDPAADIWIGCTCPECGAAQSVAFDPVSFVAREISGLMLRLLREVAEIARVFHWSERDILALPERRRAFYLAEALA